MLIFVSGASADSVDGTPAVVTESAYSITDQGVYLDTCVNPEGNDTNVTFSYGTTLEYGTTVQDEGGTISGGAGTECSGATVTGLTPGTVYYFEAMATNSSGTTTGDSGTFQTTPGALPVTASVVGGSSSDLNFVTGSNYAYLSPDAVSVPDTNIDNVSETVQQTETISNFNVSLTNSSGNDVNAQLLVNGISSGQACGVAGTGTCSDTSDTITVHAGDTLAILLQDNAMSLGSGDDVSASYSYDTDILNSPGVSDVGASPDTTGATIDAAIDPEGTSTLYYVQYGPSGDPDEFTTPVTEYGAAGSSVSFAAQAQNTTSVSTVTQTLSNLVPDSTYQYKVIAKNAGGITVSSQGSFETVVTPVIVPPVVTHPVVTPPAQTPVVQVPLTVNTPVATPTNNGVPVNTGGTPSPRLCFSSTLHALTSSVKATKHGIVLQGHVGHLAPGTHLAVFYKQGCEATHVSAHIVSAHGSFVATVKAAHKTIAKDYIVVLEHSVA